MRDKPPSLPERTNIASMTDDPLQHKLTSLQDILVRMGSLAVAFSGGADSTFLLKVAHEVLGDRVMAVTARSPAMPGRELREAQTFARELGVDHIVIQTDEFSLSDYVDNSVERCYVCKKEIFAKISAVAAQHGLRYVADGSNVDDRGDFRPGIRALRELGIVCPLSEAGLGKQEVRFLSRQKGLPTWDKPALACLSSRIPYGQRITREKVEAVERTEQYLLDLGFRQVRVRHHGDMARIEVSPGERGKFFDTALMDRVVEAFKPYGFMYVVLDLQGYRTGSLNEVIDIRDAATDRSGKTA